MNAKPPDQTATHDEPIEPSRRKETTGIGLFRTSSSISRPGPGSTSIDRPTAAPGREEWPVSGRIPSTTSDRRRRDAGTWPDAGARPIVQEFSDRPGGLDPVPWIGEGDRGPRPFHRDE